MIKISEEQFDIYERSYPGITEQIWRHEHADLPPCTHCGSTDTAVIIGAIIGRTIYLASATTKVTLNANRNGQCAYRCNACKQQFNPLGQTGY
jgi:hypothetical protein